MDRNGTGCVSRDIGAFVCLVVIAMGNDVVKAVAVAADAMTIPPIALFRK